MVSASDTRPTTAEGWVRVREDEYRTGMRTRWELVTCYTRLAGEFGAAPVVEAIDAKFLDNLRESCTARPVRGEFVTFKMSAEDSERCFAGAVALHEHFFGRAGAGDRSNET